MPTPQGQGGEPTRQPDGYAWFGLLAIVLPWAFCRRGYGAYVPVAALCVVPVNGSLWSLAVVVPMLLTAYIPGKAPRLKWLFYVAYPAHLWLLWLVGFAIDR